MPVIFTKDINVSLGGSCVWRVKQHMINTVDKVDFVKLSCCDYGFVRLCGEDIVEQMPRNPTIRSSEGYRKLIKLRNEHLAPVASPIHKLFGQSTTSTARSYKGAP